MVRPIARGVFAPTRPRYSMITVNITLRSTFSRGEITEHVIYVTLLAVPVIRTVVISLHFETEDQMLSSSQLQAVRNRMYVVDEG